MADQRSSGIGLDDLRKYFRMPEKDVAKTLGECAPLPLPAMIQEYHTEGVVRSCALALARWDPGGSKPAHDLSVVEQVSASRR
jgi:hypothetical protein